MGVIVTVQDSEGNKVGSFETEMTLNFTPGDYAVETYTDTLVFNVNLSE